MFTFTGFWTLSRIVFLRFLENMALGQNHRISHCFQNLEGGISANMRIPINRKKEEILMKKNFEINPSSFEDIFQLKTQSQQKSPKINIT